MAVGVHSFQGSVWELTVQALTASGFSQSPCDILLTELVCREATSVPILMERQTCFRLQAEFSSNVDSEWMGTSWYCQGREGSFCEGLMGVIVFRSIHLTRRQL